MKTQITIQVRNCDGGYVVSFPSPAGDNAMYAVYKNLAEVKKDMDKYFDESFYKTAIRTAKPLVN